FRYRSKETGHTVQLSVAQSACLTLVKATLPCAQAGRRGGAGPAGGSLGGKDPTGRLLRGSEITRPSRPQPPPGRQPGLVRAREDRAPPTGPPSEITCRDNFAAGPRDQPGENSDINALPEEMDRAVGRHDVSAAGMEAVEFA